ncbi:MAG: hypothetical protein K2M94_00020 [Paramuribaculum sp.]|nr:hypothetical protein [Paramuribaculum sp.]
MKRLFSLMLPLTTMLMFTACGDEPDNIKLSKTTYTMYHEDTQTIEGTNVADIVWESDNEFVATIKNGTITGQYVGKTSVKSTTQNLSFTVDVKPKYNTYEEPHLEWGASKSAIKAKYGTPTSENTNSLLYETSNSNAPIMLYMFENGKMTTCGVVCKMSTAYQLGDFLVERYVPVKVDVDNYSATLLHCYGKISDPQIDYGVAMQYNSSIGGILVAYTGVTNSKSSNIGAIDFTKVFESLESVLK